MKRPGTALHVRTGDRASGLQIAAWLDRHGVSAVDCLDAFDACVVAITEGRTTPDLAFVGTDWLAPEDILIFDYIRETWPGIIIVAYGSADSLAILQPSPLMHVCGSSESLRRMTERPPQALADASAGRLRDEAPIASAWRPTPAQSAPVVTPLKLDPPPTKTAPQPPADPAPPDDFRQGPRDESAASPPGEVPLPRHILTNEELMALLEDHDPGS